MMITERQEKILNSLVREYIDLAEPVGSQLLEKKYKLGICPATIRSEMQRLTDRGYLCQPHTSAGRVPTDKGYRFFVDELLENFGVNLEKEIENSLDSLRYITKYLASESSNLALGYLVGEKILWQEGWGEVLQEPEFTQTGYVVRFTRMLDDFEENIEKLLSPEVKIYIGKENPISKIQDFSVITAGFSGGLLAILGPKRMSYDKNISLLAHLWEKI